MPYTISIPSGLASISAQQLTKEAFAPFGTITTSPVDSSDTAGDHVKALSKGLPDTNTTLVNQRPAIRHYDSPVFVDLYRRAPSKKRGRPVTQLVSCMPLASASDQKTDKLSEDGSPGAISIGTTYHLQRLERSPFTTQTIIPFGQAASDSGSRYLVIVAPSLPVRRGSARPPPFPTPEPRRGRSFKDLLTQARPPPFPTPEPRRRRSFRDVQATARPPPFPENPEKTSQLTAALSQEVRLQGPGVPNLHRIQVFIAHGGQVITYAPGVWHAPIVALGSIQLDFMLIRLMNGVQSEDTQEVHLLSEIEGQGIPIGPLGEIKAKL